ncbi:uncharacterized protein LOC113229118 [Hyposmocoma kahamanoa]|uniref:uncharacterized protein LOC113229118 n=1 Tax=Hyposmocoma kahamanoa TaxID=1477025 RepID=UPI000E6DA1C9|nr:uncharacterized protein LOC113229118 [Hyposmocoma kahamanoa]
MVDEERSSSENVGMAGELGRAPTATVSSLKSEDSTEHLICKSPPKVKKIKSIKEQSVTSKSVEAGSETPTRKRLVVVLGLAHVVLGALLVGAGALGVARGAALARVGAGLWAGCVAVVAGVVGVLAGINDCYGLSSGANGGPLLTTFLALSLLSLACGNGAAVLAATGLQRDTMRARAPTALPSFQDEMEAWSPVLTNIGLLIIACAQCIASVASICACARRACACLRPRQPFDHNTFDARPLQSFAVHVDEKPHHDPDGLKSNELCKHLEGKLQGDGAKKKKEEPPEYGSANSKEKLVTRWLGHAGAAGVRALGAPPAALAPMVVPVGTGGLGRRGNGVRKARKLPPPVMLLPAHPASTLGRVPPACVMMGPPRYATLPLPPAPYPPPHAPVYYHMPDGRLRRRVSPRTQQRRRREGRERQRDDHLTRSLERIHRKRRAERERLAEAELKSTYTGLDRAYAEQFIAVCDESRHAHAHAHDSLPSTATSHTSDTSHTS